MSDTLRALGLPELHQRLAAGLPFRVGPFTLRITGDDALLAKCLNLHYPDYPLSAVDDFADAAIALQARSRWARTFAKPLNIALEDGVSFTSFPAHALLAHIEWSFNWCIASRGNRFLMLHGGVVSRGEQALILPGIPGAGKSTLTAYLIHRGWRLLSDEFTLVEPGTLVVFPFPRLIPLKNQSIAVIKDAVPESRFGPQIPGTRKGLVSHVCPDTAHIRQMDVTVAPRLIVFPTYAAGAATQFVQMKKSETFAELTQHAFNYALLAREGFETVAGLVDSVQAYRMTYSQLEDANERLREMFDRGEA